MNFSRYEKASPEEVAADIVSRMEHVLTRSEGDNLEILKKIQKGKWPGYDERIKNFKKDVARLINFARNGKLQKIEMKVNCSYRAGAIKTKSPGVFVHIHSKFAMKGEKPYSVKKTGDLIEVETDKDWNPKPGHFDLNWSLLGFAMNFSDYEKPSKFNKWIFLAAETNILAANEAWQKAYESAVEKADELAKEFIDSINGEQRQKAVEKLSGFLATTDKLKDCSPKFLMTFFDMVSTVGRGDLTRTMSYIGSNLSDVNFLREVDMKQSLDLAKVIEVQTS